MYHNFTFVENDNTHYFMWNPTSMLLGAKERTIFHPLDGPPIIHYQDTTETLGELVWENALMRRKDIYADIEALVGKTGVLYTNKMPQLVGQKNILNYSHLGDAAAGGGYYTVSCSGNYNGDSSIYGPDGVSLVTLYKSDVASTHAGCFVTPALSEPYTEHNVFSCYVKYANRSTVGINLYDVGNGQSHVAYFIFSGGGSILTPVPATNVQASGVEKIRNSDGWFRIWLYIDGVNSVPDGDIRGSTMQLYIYPNYGWITPEVTGSYMTDFQVEQGVDHPTWFAETRGTPISEPLTVEFLDMQTEYVDSPGDVKHNIRLNFKLIGEWM